MVSETSRDLLKNKFVWAAYYYDGGANPFSQFENKYGFAPSRVAIGPGVTIDLPGGVSVVEVVPAPPKNQLWIQ